MVNISSISWSVKVTETNLKGVFVIQRQIHRDRRGFFLEMWQKKEYQKAGFQMEFVQDNFSLSRQGVLRGLHFQYPHSQAKLVQVLEGEVYDVAVDIGIGSPTFGQWIGVTLSENNSLQLYIPPWCAHGFCVVSSRALFAYKCSDTYHPEGDAGIRWNDPALNITWPVNNPLLSEKDSKLSCLENISRDKLPPYGGERSPKHDATQNPADR